MFAGPREQSVSPNEKHMLSGVTISPIGTDGWSNRMDMYMELEQRLERLEEVILSKMANLDSELELQKTEIENLYKMLRLYDIVIEAQKTTIKNLEKVSSNHIIFPILAPYSPFLLLLWP